MTINENYIPRPESVTNMEEKQKIVNNIKKLQDYWYNIREIADITGETYVVMRMLSSKWVEHCFSTKRAKILNARFDEIFWTLNIK